MNERDRPPVTRRERLVVLALVALMLACGVVFLLLASCGGKR